MEKLTKQHYGLIFAVQKWELIKDGKIEDQGSSNCKLCSFWNGDKTAENEQCVGCPIFEKTEELFCKGTPFMEWSDHQYKRHMNTMTAKVRCDECKRLAQKEIDFLEKLKKDILDKIKELEMESICYCCGERYRRNWTENELIEYNGGYYCPWCYDDIAELKDMQEL